MAATSSEVKPEHTLTMLDPKDPQRIEYVLTGIVVRAELRTADVLAAEKPFLERRAALELVYDEYLDLVKSWTYARGQMTDASMPKAIARVAQDTVEKIVREMPARIDALQEAFQALSDVRTRFTECVERANHRLRSKREEERLAQEAAAKKVAEDAAAKKAADAAKQKAADAARKKAADAERKAATFAKNTAPKDVPKDAEEKKKKTPRAPTKSAGGAKRPAQTITVPDGKRLKVRRVLRVSIADGLVQCLACSANNWRCGGVTEKTKAAGKGKTACSMCAHRRKGCSWPTKQDEAEFEPVEEWVPPPHVSEEEPEPEQTGTAPAQDEDRPTARAVSPIVDEAARATSPVAEVEDVEEEESESDSSFSGDDESGSDESAPERVDLPSYIRAENDLREKVGANVAALAFSAVEIEKISAATRNEVAGIAVAIREGFAAVARSVDALTQELRESRKRKRSESTRDRARKKEREGKDRDRDEEDTGAPETMQDDK